MKRLYFFLLLFSPLIIKAQSSIIITFAGNGTTGYSGDGGDCIYATFSRPQNIISDNLGNLYFADADNNVIRKINTLDIVSTIAGNDTAGYTGDMGAATLASLSTPTGIALDAAGNLYIADNGNSVIRKVSSAGIITTIAGTGIFGYNGDNGPATLAQIRNPYGIAVDNIGNIYFSDASSYVVRKISNSGIITTVAGNGTTGFSGDDGQATNAQLKAPSNIGVSSSGDLYIPDWTNRRVRKVNTSGIITTVAGNGISGNSGDGFAATSAELTAPQTINFDDSGNFYISDALASVIRKVNSAGIISTVAGDGISGFSGDNGPATAAELNGPSGVTFSSVGNMYISEAYNKRIRAVIYHPEFINNILNTENTISIFPNPAYDKITFSAGEEIKSVVVVDIVGQSFGEKLTMTGSKEVLVNVADLPSGIYFVKVNGVYAGRFVKE